MKVIYWTDGYWPRVGGLEVLTDQLLPALQARGHQFLVVTAEVSRAAPPIGDRLGVAVHRFPFHQALLNHDLAEMRSLCHRVAEISRQFEPDLIHLNLGGPSVFFFLRALGFTPTPVLAALHGLLQGERSGNSLQGEALRRAAHVVGVSHAILDEAFAIAPVIASRSSVIHNGLPVPALPPAPYAAEPPHLLILSRLVVEKGVDLAVAAFARVRARHPTARLSIAGDGPERATLAEQVATLGLDDAVRFLGWVSPERVPALINTASAVVVPSRWSEPFGLVALQAAQMARPVIAARTGGLREIVIDGETGLLVENENSAALAAAICSLIEQPARAQRMGEAGRRRALDAFTFEQCVAAYDTLYRTVASERLPARGRA